VVVAVASAESSISPLTKQRVAALHPKLDTDEDGKVSFSELVEFSDSMRRKSQRATAEGSLPVTDRDGDGKVSKKELLATFLDKESKDHAEAAFEVMDVDGDGALDIEEFSHMYVADDSSPATLELMGKPMVKRMDSDGDGLVSEKEFEKFTALHDSAVFADAFSKLDKDGSGKLDAAEMLTVATGRFAEHHDMRQTLGKADADGDGHISLEELHGAREDLSGSLLVAWAREATREEL